jgi:hypothetical protein
MRPYSRLGHQTSFEKKQKGWKLHPEDKKKNLETKKVKN